MLKEKHFVIQEAFSKKKMQLYQKKMPQIALEIKKTSKKLGLLPFFFAIFVKFLIHLLA